MLSGRERRWAWSSEPGVVPQRLGVGRTVWMGGILEQQPMLCSKAMQDLSSAISESFWDSFQFSCSFRYDREKLPEVGFNQEIFLGVRRRTVERTVLETEEAQCFLDARASAPVPAVGPGRGDATLGPPPGLRHTQMLSPGLRLKIRPQAGEDAGAQ